MSHIPIIGGTRVVELRVKVTEDVARRIFSDQQRSQASIHQQAALLAALVLKYGVDGRLDLDAEVQGAGVALARKVGASYHAQGGVTLFLLGTPGAPAEDGEEQGGEDVEGGAGENEGVPTEPDVLPEPAEVDAGAVEPTAS